MPRKVDELDRQQVHDAYMRVRGASCEEACAFVEAMLASPEVFRGYLEQWAEDFLERMGDGRGR